MRRRAQKWLATAGSVFQLRISSFGLQAICHFRFSNFAFRHSGEAVGGEQSGHLQDALVIVALRELRGGGAIEEKRYVGMKLQRRSGNGAGDGTFDGFGDGSGFGGAGGEQKNFARLENRADAHGDGAARALFAGGEEFGVVVERFATQDFEPRSRLEVGSLKPMWPLRPMPRSCKSIPPAARIACS